MAPARKKARHGVATRSSRGAGGAEGVVGVAIRAGAAAGAERAGGSGAAEEEKEKEEPSADEAQPPAELLCPVTQDIFHDPVILVGTGACATRCWTAPTCTPGTNARKRYSTLVGKWRLTLQPPPRRQASPTSDTPSRSGYGRRAPALRPTRSWGRGRTSGWCPTSPSR